MIKNIQWNSIICVQKLGSRKKVFVKDSMSNNKMWFLFVSLSWLANELLWSINKLKQGLWCNIWLSYIYIYIYQRVISVFQFPYNYNFKFSVTPRFTLKSSLLIVSNTFKTDLLRNPWGICSSIVDLKVGNSPSHEVKQTNRLKNMGHWKLFRDKAKIKQTKICVIRCP